MSHNRRNSQNVVNPRRYGFDDDISNYVVALCDGCYICCDTYSSAGTARSHIRNIHGFDIPSRINGADRPLDIYYEYVTPTHTDEYDELHYACPFCWFHCPMDEPGVFYDHTIVKHNPRRITIGDENKYDRDTGTSSRSRGYPRRSRPSSRQSYVYGGEEEVTNSRPNSRQGYVSDGEEEVPNSRPNSRQVRISNEREGVSSIREDGKNELVQKINEFIDLFHSLLRK
ncbi:hypothetical protein HPULCUR_011451 [Helicostylum pulchrum]|uniref:C2H2-type domain-containing protein n=1 Tax=Helicostylum pulchrum TaxID=562976 RepID=A0ABP9YGX5_9FUNG